MRKLLASSFLIATFGLFSTAQAAVVSVSETLDLAHSGLASSGFTYTQDVPPFSSANTVTLNLGDTLDLSIDFTGNQSLTLVNPQTIWGYLYGNTSTDVTGTGTLSLLDANGNTFIQSDLKTDTEGSAHFGQFFGPGDFTGGLPVTLTFYGLHYVGTVDSYADGSLTRDYAVPALALDADSISVSGAVPEPASWALMLGGFGMIGGAMRSRKKAAVTFA